MALFFFKFLVAGKICLTSYGTPDGRSSVVEVSFASAGRAIAEPICFPREVVEEAFVSSPLTSLLIATAPPRYLVPLLTSHWLFWATGFASSFLHAYPICWPVLFSGIFGAIRIGFMGCLFALFGIWHLCTSMLFYFSVFLQSPSFFFVAIFRSIGLTCINEMFFIGTMMLSLPPPWCPPLKIIDRATVVGRLSVLFSSPVPLSPGQPFVVGSNRLD